VRRFDNVLKPEKVGKIKKYENVKNVTPMKTLKRFTCTMASKKRSWTFCNSNCKP